MHMQRPHKLSKSSAAHSLEAFDERVVVLQGRGAAGITIHGHVSSPSAASSVHPDEFMVCHTATPRLLYPPLSRYRTWYLARLYLTRVCNTCSCSRCSCAAPDASAAARSAAMRSL